MKAVITLEQLENLHACGDQVDKFRELFGESVEVTEELALKHTGDFDFDWVARKLLRPPVLAEYERVCASARAEYTQTCASAWAEYKRVCASARVRVCASARAEYEQVFAVTFANLYVQQAQTPE